MSSAVALLVAFALVLAALALWLWQRATATSGRLSAQRFIDSRIAPATNAAQRPPAGASVDPARLQPSAGAGGMQTRADPAGARHHAAAALARAPSAAGMAAGGAMPSGPGARPLGAASNVAGHAPGGPRPGAPSGAAASHGGFGPAGTARPTPGGIAPGTGPHAGSQAGYPAAMSAAAAAGGFDAPVAAGPGAPSRAPGVGPGPASGPVASPAPAPKRAAATAVRPAWLGPGLWHLFVPLHTWMSHRLSRAGVADMRLFYTLEGGLIVVASLVAYLRIGPCGVLIAVLACAGLTHFALWLRVGARKRLVVHQIPAFLDSIVRLVTIGNSVSSAFQAAIPTAENPLRECLERVSRMMRAGVDIDKALMQASKIYDVREFDMISAVLRLSMKYGGRADVVLDRMSAFMRDTEQAQRELVAMSAETRLSAWVLGLLPVALATMVIMLNPQYFMSMWAEPSGRQMMMIAFALQAAGGFMLYRLVRL